MGPKGPGLRRSRPWRALVFGALGETVPVGPWPLTGRGNAVRFLIRPERWPLFRRTIAIFPPGKRRGCLLGTRLGLFFTRLAACRLEGVKRIVQIIEKLQVPFLRRKPGPAEEGRHAGLNLG